MNTHERDAMEAAATYYVRDSDECSVMDSYYDHEDTFRAGWKAARAYTPPVAQDQTLEEAATQGSIEFYGDERYGFVEAFKAGAQFQAARAAELVEALEHAVKSLDALQAHTYRHDTDAGQLAGYIEEDLSEALAAYRGLDAKKAKGE